MDGVNKLLLSENLLEIESGSDDDVSQRPSSQNTLFTAAAALNGPASPFKLSPLTHIGSPGTEERKEDHDSEDANDANMSQAKVIPRGGAFGAIKQRLDQESH